MPSVTVFVPDGEYAKVLKTAVAEKKSAGAVIAELVHEAVESGVL